MTDVAAFVLARLAEWKQSARAAEKHSPSPWWVDGPGVKSDKWWVYATGEKFLDRETADHIARHDPARVLAQVAALRAIVEFHESWPVLVETEPEFTTDPTATTLSMAKRMAWLTEREYRERFGVEPPTAPMLRALAGIWADHEQYDPAWRA